MKLNRYVPMVKDGDVLSHIEKLNAEGYTVIQLLPVGDEKFRTVTATHTQAPPRQRNSRSLYNILAAALHLTPEDNAQVAKYSR